MENPTYREVGSGATGHNEVVRIVYNPSEVTYRALLKIFWDTHDPTTPNRQVGLLPDHYNICNAKMGPFCTPSPVCILKSFKHLKRHKNQ